jgi:hypothetical protein
MIVLVDYDNVEMLERSRGVEHVVTKLVGNIGAAALALTPRIRGRLYGGWYEGYARTRQAQILLADVGAAFPKPVSVSDGATSTTALVNVEVVSSLEIEPAFEYHRTYRPQGESGRLNCVALPFAGCTVPTGCALAPLHQAVVTKKCPNQGCGVALSDILTRPQQKLVDTLLTADLIHFAATSASWVALASCDDDLWPGIRTALTFGKPIIHLQTKAGRQPSSTYAPTAPSYSYRMY